MFKDSTLMWMYAEHPIHAGSGGGVGAIDLPIQRERVTGWPIIQPTGLKGALREHFEKIIPTPPITDYGEKIVEVFGPANSGDHSGAASFTEAKVLFFPVRSLKGVFGYVTCPLALKRFRRELEAIKSCGNRDFMVAKNPRPALPNFGSGTPNEDQVWVISNSVLKASLTLNSIIFEELCFNADSSKSTEIETLASWLQSIVLTLPWLFQTNLAERLAIVHDNIFKDFVEMSTEVITRNRINNETGIVEQHMLWNEEHLPRETVLYSAIFATKPFVSSPKLADGAAVLNFLKGGTPPVSRRIWVGGDTTVGKGLANLSFASE